MCSVLRVCACACSYACVCVLRGCVCVSVRVLFTLRKPSLPLISEVFLFGTANGIYLLSYINECCACCNIFAVLSIDIYLEWLNAVEKRDR